MYLLQITLKIAEPTLSHYTEACIPIEVFLWRTVKYLGRGGRTRLENFLSTL